MVAPDVKTAADLKGKRLSATGGGVGGFNWRMGREVLKTAGLTVDDAQFIASATAGRLPGLIAGQIDAVALHPEDVYLAKKQKPTLNLLVQLAELMPNYMFNAYGASLDWIAPRPRAAARCRRRDDRGQPHDVHATRPRSLPIIVKATDKPKEAVEYAIDVLTKNCVWSINGGFDPDRTALDDRQQRRERRHRQGQEAVGRAGREFRPRQRGGRCRRRPRQHRQLQGLTHVAENARPGPDPGREPAFRTDHAQARGNRHEHPDAASRRTPELGRGAHAPRPERAVLEHVRHAVLPRRGL